jgi:hypothetical protein
MREPTTGSIGAAGQFELGNPMIDRVCSYLIQFQSTDFIGSVTIKGAVDGKAYTTLGLAYKNMVTGLNATGAITGNALVLVDASGIGISLDCTSYTDGTLAYKAIPLIG